MPSPVITVLSVISLKEAAAVSRPEDILAPQDVSAAPEHSLSQGIIPHITPEQHVPRPNVAFAIGDIARNTIEQNIRIIQLLLY